MLCTSTVTFAVLEPKPFVAFKVYAVVLEGETLLEPVKPVIIPTLGAIERLE